MKDFGIIFLSSGRTPYLKATINSILRSKIDLGVFALHVVANDPSANYDFITERSDFVLHNIKETHQSGLLKYAFNLGITYSQCLFIEEDWLFNENLSNDDLFTLVKIPNTRQILFSKYRLGHEEELSNIWGKSRKKWIDGFNREVLEIDTYFSLNPTIIKRVVLQEICDKFDWLLPTNSGRFLEMNLDKFLGDKFGPTVSISGDPKFNVRHLGILTASKYFRLTKKNRMSQALFIMKVHVFLFKIKDSNYLLRRIHVPINFH